MDPQQQPPPLKNILIFLIFSTALLLGWMWLQPILWPQAEPVEQKKDQKQAQKDKKSPKEKQAKKAKPPEPRQPSPADVQRMLVSAVAASPGDPLRVVALAWKNGDLFVVSPTLVGQPAAKTIELGGKGFHLRAVLTTLGGGVQQLTLNRFKAADWYGLPEYDKDGEPLLLDLIPADPYRPSFRLYHYPHPDLPSDPPGADRPDLTLGERMWKLEGRKTGDDGEQSITFSTPGPPGYEFLKIRKTFTLRPGWYHLGLKIEITGRPSSVAKAKPFRYQLTGAHGLPIEGGWYNYTHRNAAVGILSPRNELIRTLVQAREISFKEGGEKVPDAATRGNDAILFGAVCTQFFTSVVVVDDEQEDGKDWRNILAYARPTVESQERRCQIVGISSDKKLVRVTFLDESESGAQLKLMPHALEMFNKDDMKLGEKVIVNVATAYENGKARLIAIDFRRGEAVKGYLDDVTVRMVSEPLAFDPETGGGSYTHKFLLYNGPVKIHQLDNFSGEEAVDPALVTRYADTLHLNTLQDYQSWWLWKTIYWTDLLIYITSWMHWLLIRLYWLIAAVNLVPHVISNEALAIILLTVLVRGMMFPISRRAALMSTKMQALAPEMKKLQEKYKDDLQARNQAVWELYRRHKVNPMGGCLPLFLQLPIFLGLYYALQESILFRLAPFLFGGSAFAWPKNLAAPDMLFYWGQGFPFLTNPDDQGGAVYLGPFFNLLPVVAAVLMLLQQKMIMPPPTDEQQEMQQKMMKYMTVIFALMFYKVAAGLCLYFIASTLWGITERRLLPKKKPVPGETPPPAKDGIPAQGPKPKPGGGRKKDRKKPKKEEPDTAMKKVRGLWEEILKQAKKK